MSEPTQERIDEYMDTVHEIVHRVGWAVQGVFPVEGGDLEVPWAYTVGLHRKGWPELCITGLGMEQCESVLNSAVHYYRKEGIEPRAGECDGILEGYIAHLQPCSPWTDEFPFSVARRLDNIEWTDLDAMQIVWPDTMQRFPWHFDYDPKFVQPLVGV